MRKIGERIKILRIRKELTQTQLGVLLGFNESSAGVRIAQYENNRKMPRDNVVKKLIFLFDINEYALLSNYEDEIINICIDMYWQGLMGQDILLVYRFFDLLKEYDEERYTLFNEIIKGI